MIVHKPIETERLILREVMLSDLDGMFELDSNSEVHKYLGNKPISNREQAITNIEFLQKQYNERGIARWAVIHKETNEFMGWSGIKYLIESEKVNGFFNIHELGYRLLPKFWGKGFATESAKAFVDYAFNKMHVTSLYATADSCNKGSIRVLEKVGFKTTSNFVLNFNEFKVNCSWLEQHLKG
jgi:RimJ/RimL family protein N-acetyltransferase